jgi:hypothetical protein
LTDRIAIYLLANDWSQNKARVLAKDGSGYLDPNAPPVSPQKQPFLDTITEDNEDPGLSYDYDSDSHDDTISGPDDPCDELQLSNSSEEGSSEDDSPDKDSDAIANPGTLSPPGRFKRGMRRQRKIWKDIGGSCLFGNNV